MTPRHTIVTRALFGALLFACLPRFPDGERGVQCWTDRAADRTRCDRIALWCFEDAKDVTENDECLSELERCRVASDLLAEQCERRTGCIATQAACEEDCGGEFEAPSGCIDQCRVELELCAPWLDLDCERECGQPLYECLATATHTFHEAACDREHLDCVFDCYDRAPQEGAEQGTCDPGRYTCDDDRITACVNGDDVRGYSCDEICAALGSQSTGCNDGQCGCVGQPTDGTVCDRGVSVICTCSAEIDGIPCSSEDISALQQECQNGGGLPFECFADYIDNVPEACEAIVFGDACFCPWTDDGECDEPEGTGICPEGTDPGDC